MVLRNILLVFPVVQLFVFLFLVIGRTFMVLSAECKTQISCIKPLLNEQQLKEWKNCESWKLTKKHTFNDCFELIEFSFLEIIVYYPTLLLFPEAPHSSFIALFYGLMYTSVYIKVSAIFDQDLAIIRNINYHTLVTLAQIDFLENIGLFERAKENEEFRTRLEILQRKIDALRDGRCEDFIYSLEMEIERTEGLSYKDMFALKKNIRRNATKVFSAAQEATQEATKVYLPQQNSSCSEMLKA